MKKTSASYILFIEVKLLVKATRVVECNSRSITCESFPGSGKRGNSTFTHSFLHCTIAKQHPKTVAAQRIVADEVPLLRSSLSAASSACMKGELQYQHILGSASHPPSALNSEVFPLIWSTENKTKSSMERNYVARNTHKEDNSFGFEEHTWGTSWPARSYACSFCKREFKSAQALGGHMNVHRRDRARLRSSLSSWVSDSPKPSPSINKPNSPTHFSPSSPSHLSDELLNCTHKSSPLHSPSLTLSSYSLSPASTSGDKKPRLASQVPLLSPQSREIKMISKSTRSALGVEGLKGCAMEDEHKVFKNSNEHNITLELGIGLLKHPNEKLDLELRLGH